MSRKLGIYVHIPFCASKCGYCDFYSLAGCDRLMPKYQDALVEHIRESYGTLKATRWTRCISAAARPAITARSAWPSCGRS